MLREQADLQVEVGPFVRRRGHAVLADQDEGRKEDRLRRAGRSPRRALPRGHCGSAALYKHCRARRFRFGKLDILVNNAAFQRTYERIEDITAEEWDRTFRVNVHAMFYLSQAAVPHMRPGAAIVNKTSIQSKDPSPHSSPTPPPRARSRTSRPPWRRCWRTGAYPRERRSGGPDLDAAHPIHNAGGEGGELQPAEPAFARGPA